MKKVTLSFALVFVLVSSLVFAQTIVLQPAKGYDGVKPLPFIKVFYSSTESLVLDWDKSLPAGCSIKIGSSPGNYNITSISLDANSVRKSFIPGKLSLLTIGRYYAIITNSTKQNLSDISADAAAVYSNEIQFVMESPEAPKATAPIGSINISTPEFRWGAIPGVSAYWIICSSTEFKVKTDSLGNNPAIQGANIMWDYITTANNATYGDISPSSPFTKSAIPLFPGNRYYYTILNLYDPIDVAFASSVFGGMSDFLLPSVSQIDSLKLISPSDTLHFPGDETIRFQWNPVQGANSYTVYLLNRVTQFAGNNQQIDLPVWNGSTTNTSLDFAARQNLLGGKYVWFVVPTTGTGSGNQSIKHTFSYDVPMSTFSAHLKNAADSTDLISYSFSLSSTTGGYSPSVPYIVSNSSSYTDSIPTDVYQITAKKNGYFDSTFTFAVNGTKQKPTQVNLYLTQFPSSVSGKVVDTSGIGVQDAAVLLTNVLTNAVTTIKTSSSGSFSGAIPKASYRLNVNKPGYLSPLQTNLTVNQSQVILSNSLVLIPDKATLSGTVMNDDNQPVQLAEIKATQGATVQWANSSGTGSYSFNLSSGAWIVEVSKQGFVSPNPITLNLSKNDNFQGQNLVLIPRANQVTGTVYKVIKTGTQSSLSPFSKVVVTATPISGQVISAVTGSNGQFSLSLKSGSYIISVDARGYTANTNTQVTLGVGQTLTAVDFTMTPNQSSVSGIISETGGTPVADAVISDGTVSTVSLSTGNYQMSLASGNHTLTVTKSGYVTPDTIAVSLSPGQPLSGINFSLDANAATITGSVSSLGNSLPNAIIYASKGSKTLETKSSSSGSFVLSVQPGTWKIYAAKQGFKNSPPESFPESFFVGAGQTSANHNYSLVENIGTIKGNITTGGSPLANVTVTAKDKNNNANVFSTLSNISGSYSLSVPAERDYTLSAALTGYTTYNDASVPISAAGALQVVNAAVNPVPALITGKVLDNNLQPVNNAKVYLTINSALIDSTITSVTGEYKIGSSVGKAKLSAFLPGYTRDNVDNITVSLGQTLTNINFKISPNYALLSGTIKDQDGKAIEGAFISLTAASSGGTSQSAADGSFVISNLVGNTFTFTASKTDTTISKSRYADTTIQNYDIKDGETKSISIKMTKLDGTIAGKITGKIKENIPSATVYLYDTKSSKTVTAISDPAGKYLVSGLPLSTYMITADKAKYSSSQQIIKTLTSSAQKDSADINDFAKNKGQVKGILTDKVTGAVISGAAINARSSKSAGSAVSGLDGKFLIPDLENDSNWVFFEKTGYVQDLTQRDSTPFSFQLKPSTMKITGTVKNQAPAGLGFATTVKASSGQTILSTTTDVAGNFTFNNGNPGATYNVFTEIFKDGYVNADTAFTTMPSAQSVGPIQLFVSVRNASISGTVGTPSAVISVKNKTTNETFNSVSNSDGTYSVNFLLNGSYTVTVSKTGFTFSPTSVADIDLAVGASRIMDFIATKSSGNLTVNTKDESGVSLDSVSVNITSTDTLYSYSGLSKSGTFTFTGVPTNGVPTKEFVLQVNKTGYSSQSTPKNVTIANNVTATENVTLIKNNVSLSGTVVKDTTLSNPSGVSVAGANVEYRNTATGQTFSVVSESNGNYTFGSLAAGAATISASFTGYKSDTLTDNLVTGMNYTKKNITLSPTFVKLSGKVTYKGAGLANTTVTALSSNSFSTTTDLSGEYSFSALPIKTGTGDTTIYRVSISGTDFQTRDTSVPVPASMKGQSVRLPDFSIPSGKISVTINDGESTALSDVNLIFVRPDGNQSQTVTDKTGKFETQPKLSAGKYKLNISRDNYLSPNDSLTVFNLVNDNSTISRNVSLRYKLTPLTSIDASNPATVTVFYKGTLPALDAKLKYQLGTGSENSVDSVNLANSTITWQIPALHSLVKVTYYVVIRETSTGVVYTSDKYTLTPEAVGILSSISFKPLIDKATLRKNDTYEISMLVKDGKNNSLLSSFQGTAPKGTINWNIDTSVFKISYPKATSGDSTVILLTTLKDTTSKITASGTLNGFSVSQEASVTVGNVILKSINVTKSVQQLSNKSSGLQFSYSGIDTASKAVMLGTNLKWSIVPVGGGTIDSTGFFKPVDSLFIGNVEVTALDKVSGKKGITDLTVYADVDSTSNMTLTDKDGMNLKIVPGSVMIPVKVTLGKAQFGPAKKNYITDLTSYVVSDKQYFITYLSDIKIAGDTTIKPMTLEIQIDPSLRAFEGAKTIGYYNTTSNEWTIRTTNPFGAASFSAEIISFGEYSILAENEPLGIKYAAVLPTPFSPKIAPVQIGYKLNSLQPPATVTIKIFNMRGELVKNVIQNDLQMPGVYKPSTISALAWDGKTNDGYEANNGRYIIQISAKDPSGEVTKLIPVVLVK